MHDTVTHFKNIGGATAGSNWPHLVGAEVETNRSSLS